MQKNHQHPKSFVTKSDRMENLLTQLELVQRFAQEGFWVTTEELTQLLGIESGNLQSHKQFPWRNFVCSQIETQGSQKFWQIAKGASLQLPTANLPPILEATSNGIVSSSYAQIENFLSIPQWQELQQFVLTEEANFVSTTTSTGAEDHRKSRILYQFPRFNELMVQRIQQIVPHVLTYLNHPAFTVSAIECQLTMHNDGHYYRIHNDNGSPDCATRVLTYVYYFCQEPKAFTGGELRIYDMTTKNGYYVAADTYHDVQPINNSIVFFFSEIMHEVLPISCPSREFAASRFTINGWVRRP